MTSTTDRSPPEGFGAPQSEDADLFREHMADAAPLKQEKAEPYRRRLPPRPLPQPEHLRETDRELLVRHIMSKETEQLRALRSEKDA